jgi:hypothetical protein
MPTVSGQTDRHSQKGRDQTFSYASGARAIARISRQFEWNFSNGDVEPQIAVISKRDDLLSMVMLLTSAPGRSNFQVSKNID